MDDLRFDRIRIGREGRLFHQDLISRFRWSIERRHHQVKIDREAVHADDFVRPRADEPRRRLAQRLVIRVPRRRTVEMRIHRERCPIVQLLVDDLSRRFRHRPEGIPGEVDDRLAVLTEWEMKFFPEMTKWILGVELTREIFVRGESHRHKNQPQTFNIQRSTSNAEFRNRQPSVGPGSQHSTINHQLL